MQVFKGIDTRTGEGVAIKQLSLAGISADTLHSIMGEIDLLKNLNHKNIVKYIGSFKTRTHLYIILEFMDNGALSNVIKPTKYGAFPESLVAIYIAQVPVLVQANQGPSKRTNEGLQHCGLSPTGLARPGLSA